IESRHAAGAARPAARAVSRGQTRRTRSILLFVRSTCPRRPAEGIIGHRPERARSPERLLAVTDGATCHGEISLPPDDPPGLGRTPAESDQLAGRWRTGRSEAG